MTKFQDFKYPNVRKLFRGHLIGAFIGAVVAYWAFTIYNTNPTFAAFAVTPLEKVLDFAKVEGQSIMIIALITGLGAFIGAYLQARGKY